MIHLLTAKRAAVLMALLAIALLAAGPAGAQVDFSPVAQPAVQAAAPAAPAPAAAAPAPFGPAAPGTSVELSSGMGMSANKVYTGQLITLDFQNADIHNILRLIGEVSGKNVVVSDQVAGRVTLKLRDVPWDQALDTVLDSKNLGVIETGNILRIYTKEAIARLQPDINDPATRVAMVRKIFTPKYASPTALFTEMDKGKSMRGTVRVIGNDIYVEDDYYTMQAINEIFSRNDEVIKQILIEARIVEANNSFRQKLGVSWGGSYDNKGTGTMADKGLTPSNALGDSGQWQTHEFYGALDTLDADSNYVSRIGVGFLNRSGTFALSAELNASESQGLTRTVSSPRIMAANDQEVYIKQGTQIPYTTSTANNGSNTQFKDAVMELRVTPHIEQSGELVSLDITLTKDSFGSQSDSGEIMIDTKEAKTKLMVRDGETVVIGGIVEDTQFSGSNQVPGLHRVPLLGWLFQNKDVNDNKKELLIFITANILPMAI